MKFFCWGLKVNLYLVIPHKKSKLDYVEMLVTTQ
jgi:hypothetical protein